MKYGGGIFEGRHEPLISKKLFDKCQEVMNKRGKVQEVRKHNFAFLGLLKCASCDCSITGERQKGHNYYRCTKKKGLCQEKHYLREEALTEQIKNFLQKVSLSSQDTDKILAALDSEQEQAKQQAQSKVEILKKQLNQMEVKLAKLLDIFLADTLSAEEYAAKKQELLSQKISLSEKISDFEQKGGSWLEPAREFVLSLNQAAKLVETENKKEMTTFLKNIGSNHILQNRQLIFSPKIPYNLVAERSEANRNRLRNSYWCEFTTKLELFFRIRFSLRPASALKFFQNFSSKTGKISPFLFEEKIGRAKSKKWRENFSALGFFGEKRRKPAV